MKKGRQIGGLPRLLTNLSFGVTPDAAKRRSGVGEPKVCQ